MRKISYHKNNYAKDKLIHKNNLNYLKAKDNLSKEEKEELLGLVGSLSDDDRNELIYEVLNPIGYNLIVTTKEIDFIIDKLGKLLGEALNKSLNFMWKYFQKAKNLIWLTHDKGSMWVMKKVNNLSTMGGLIRYN